jgi:hypothetical protein
MPPFSLLRQRPHVARWGGYCVPWEASWKSKETGIAWPLLTGRTDENSYRRFLFYH